VSTLTFEVFWAWLKQHPNCIVRAGTPETVLYDDEPLHWYIGEEGPECLVQSIHGKQVVGEIAVDPDEIAYVEALGEERQGEHVFEAISETENERVAAYYFVLSHGMAEDEQATAAAHGPAVH
jgi:hypothetical protein